MIDCHLHTNLSYCASDDMTLDFYVKALVEHPEIEKGIIADHGMALYFPYGVAWSWEYISDSSIFDKHSEWGSERVEKYIEALKPYSDKGIIPGIEVEMMNDGRVTLEDRYRKEFQVIIGSVHFLPVATEKGYTQDEVLDFWLKHTKQLCSSGIDILGHPFRWLEKNSGKVQNAIIDELVDFALEKGVALEINSHFETEADPYMLSCAVSKGVKIAWGTDAHRRHEFGDFSYHRKVLENSGIRFEDIEFFSPS